MSRIIWIVSGLLSISLWLELFAATPVLAANVKITPLGSHNGEFCSRDRAMILEDPDGTRLLYDPGQTIAGAGDKRLGRVDAILISHMHGDHVGNAHIKHVNAGTCAKPEISVNDSPNTNTVNIAIAKHASIVSGSEMPKFFAHKLEALGGDPKHSLLVRFGASRKIGGVTLTTVPAVHSNGIAGSMVGGELGKLLDAAGLTAYAGPPTGFVLTFSNGLVVYLSGDTGITAEQQSVVRGYYHARLVVMNIGDTYTTGPREAAYVVNDMIMPNAVIPSHANEAATLNGKVIPGTRTDTFIKACKVAAYLPLSGRTMEFNQDGKCLGGC